MRRWTPVALAIAFAAAACIPFRHAPNALSVMVFNIHAGKDAAGKDNLQDLAALIRTTRPDLVLLQEVDRGTRRSGNVDQLQVLTAATKYPHAFGRSLDYDGGQYGIAALTRRWFVFSHTTPLPVTPVQERAGGSHEPRAALTVVTGTPLGNLQALTTHLDASGDERYRLQEVAELLVHAHARLAPQRPVVVGGDFNAEPQSATIKRMLGAGWRDAWAECGQGEGLTYPADTPRKRIDYLFLGGSIRCTSARVIDTRISDHRPLLVTVTFTGS